MAGTEPLLRIRDVSLRFGGVVALDGVSFDVARGEICGLIGPNGAGKTTLFNCLSRLYVPDAGEIVFNGQPLLSVPAHRIAALGIARTFQNLALFRTLSVRQNILVGAHTRSRTGFVSDALRLVKGMAGESTLAEWAGKSAEVFKEDFADVPRAQTEQQRHVALGHGPGCECLGETLVDLE